MSQTTGKGTPYVEPTDPVTEYPTTSRALAEQIDKLVGEVAAALAKLPAVVPVSATVTIPKGQQYATKVIPFGHTFPGAPVAVVTVHKQLAGYSLAVSTPTTTGVEVRVRNDAGPVTAETDVPVYVVAVER